jgi:hypothetical protein
MRRLLCRLVHLALSTLPPCHVKVAWTCVYGLWMPAALHLCSSAARRRGGWEARRSDRAGCRQVDIQKLWVFISSLILGSAFVFGNSLKQLYESVFFLFMVHPFDVGAPPRPARQARPH